MLALDTFKFIIVSASLAVLLNGCNVGPSGKGAGTAQAPAPQRQDRKQGGYPQAPVARQTEQATAVSAQPPPPVSAPAQVTVKEVPVDPADIEFVQQRMEMYEVKFDQWLAISEVELEENLAEEVSSLETDCMQKLERILTGYSLLLERMQQNKTVPEDRIATVDPRKMQQIDIAFLESRCGELLAMEIPARYESVPADKSGLSFNETEKNIITQVEQGNYQEAITSYSQLSRLAPGQTPSLSARLHYGLALQYTGQVEAAARHFEEILNSGDLAVDPLSLQREIADLLLAGGNIGTAESHYDRLVQDHEAMGAEKSWAAEQLAFLRSEDPNSQEMIAYTKLLREFQTQDYRTHGAQLNEMINRFAMEHAGSPVAASALRLKIFAEASMKLWFGRQLAKIDALIAEKRFSEAMDILKNITRYYLPADLQAIVQRTYYEVGQAEFEEVESQRRIQEMELSQQWDAAVSLLDSQHFDSAIPAFQTLLGTEYEEQAKAKIVEAANLAAGQMRKEAASLFVSAGKSTDLEKKKELLLASHRLLTEIQVKYPQTDLLDKVNQNIAILEVQIKKIDPAWLEGLQQENPAGTNGPEPLTLKQQ